jgi:hypothetical protein
MSRFRNKILWCPGAGSNHRHCDFQSHALPTELPGQVPARAAGAPVYSQAHRSCPPRFAFGYAGRGRARATAEACPAQPSWANTGYRPKPALSSGKHRRYRARSLSLQRSRALRAGARIIFAWGCFRYFCLAPPWLYSASSSSSLAAGTA